MINNDFFGLEEADVAEFWTEQAPFVGNTIFWRTDEWHDYPHYTLYEVSETVSEVFQEQIVSHLESHEVASELTAVENDCVVYGGMTYQGPIIHLFQLELAASELYPETFGDEQLFDRQRVADIMTGEFQ